MKKILTYFGLPELVIFLRQLVISAFCWKANPLLLDKLDISITILIMFIFLVIINMILIKISDFKKNDWFGIESVKRLRTEGIWAYQKKETLTIKLMRDFAMQRKVSLVSLFIFIPYLFTLLKRSGYDLYNGINGFVNWALFLLSSLVASSAWTLFMEFLWKPYIYPYMLQQIISGIEYYAYVYHIFVN